MLMDYCPDCQRIHADGMCAENIYQNGAPAPEIVQPSLPRLRMKLSEALDQWTVIYERNLAEFASETGGVPTREHVRRAEQLADREIRNLFAT